MALVIEVEFLLDVFAASDGSHDWEPPEWPPAPARMFSALVAGCAAEEVEALSWLENQPHPVIEATDRTATTDPQARWLVTNRLVVNGGSAEHPARKNVQRARCRTWMANPIVRYVWEQVDPPAGVVEQLDGAARQGRLPRPLAVTRVDDGD